MSEDSEDLCLVDSVETVDVIQVQTEVEACNVEYIKVENNDVLEYKGGLFALIDRNRWIPVEVNISTGPDGGQRFIVRNEAPECAKVSNEEENVETQDASQILILDDGRIAYLQPTSSVESNIVEESDVSIKEVETKAAEGEPEKKKGKNYACMVPGCNRAYSTLHHLKVHSRNHTGDRPFKCTAEGCTKAFSTDYSRKAHLRTHTGEKPYSCPSAFCSKKFKTSGDLNKHIRIHTGERPFVCPFKSCNRSFTTSNIRKVHIRTHTGEKPYACTHEGCDKSFASSTNFKNHMRIHSGVKPFCCKVPNCLKRFTEYSSLYKHQLVHTQQKKHQCNFCQKTYRQPSTLTTHKRTTHGVISADDGTEIVIEDMIGLGGSRSKNFKDITSKLLKLKRDCSAIVTIEEEGSPLYLVSTDIEGVHGLEESDILI